MKDSDEAANNSCTEDDNTDTDTLLTHPPSKTAFLLETPPLTYDDFDPKDIKLNRDQVETIEEFEVLWTEFLEDHPNILPAGKKGDRIESLERKILALQTSKQNVAAELQRQLDFFENSKEQLELNFERLKAQAQKEQEQVLEEMASRLDAVGTAARNLQANGDWELFFEALDDAVEQSDVKTLPGDGLATLLGISAPSSPRSKASSSAIKPSARAMFLNNSNAESDIHLRSRDFLLRAFRIDNGLLHAQVKMLQRDVERVQQGTKTVDMVGKFLTEHNIWGLLSSSTSSSSSQSGGGGGQHSSVYGSMVSRPTMSAKSPRAAAY